jgi:hypothetical protein
MRREWALLALLVGAVGGAIAGYEIANSGLHPTTEASTEVIRAAQRSSYWGTTPEWIDWSGEAARMRVVRDHSYAKCFRDRSIIKRCAQEQDDAIRASVLVPVLLYNQRLSNRKKLSWHEAWIADHPEIERDVRAYCWRLYQDNGERDARILAACLGNLVGGGYPVIEWPVS